MSISDSVLSLNNFATIQNLTTGTIREGLAIIINDSIVSVNGIQYIFNENTNLWIILGSSTSYSINFSNVLETTLNAEHDGSEDDYDEEEDD